MQFQLRDLPRFHRDRSCWLKHMETLHTFTGKAGHDMLVAVEQELIPALAKAKSFMANSKNPENRRTMKTRTLYLFLFLPTLLFGQKTNHFNHLDSKWNVARTYPAANQQNPNFVATTTTIYGYRGDTLINNQQWFKLYATNDSLFQKNLVYQGLTRTENNRVLYQDATYQLDTLYDFDLKVGDSVLFNLFGKNPEKIPVTDIDSIEINGETCKRFRFAEPKIIAFDEFNEVWIEGIGSIHGPLFPHFPVKFSQEMPDSMLLTCTYSDSQQRWQHPSYSACYIQIVLGMKTQEDFNFNVYPNPFSERITIENNRKEIFDLTILNSSGQIVRKMKISSIPETIDLTELTNGIYLLRINSKEINTTIKLVKNHQP